MTTSGGAKLRELREVAGRTQLWVEAEAELGTGYLQRVESGKVAQPGRATVERILAALGARFSERRKVLERFGYSVSVPSPSDEDLAWASAAACPQIDAFPFPAYVLDCTHRLVAWNRALPRLIGARPDDPHLRGLAGDSFLGAWFVPSSPLAPLVVEPDVFLPALIRAFRHERQQFGSEPWYASILDRLMALPEFRRYWSMVEREPPPASATRALVPLRLAVPGAGVLQFRLATEPFTRDGRLRIVFYFPADPATMIECAGWTT